jgi:ribulose-phosphate 3-epimerase
MTEIIPSIIPKNKEQLEDEIDLISSFADFVQIDISDGIFAPVKTWPYNGLNIEYFDDLKNENAGWPKWKNIDFEVHLMVSSPENILRDWIQTGISSAVAHIEATENFQKIIDICRENQVKIWIAIKPSTDISLLAPFAGQVDGIQAMGSDRLGEHGIALENRALKQIEKLREKFPDTPVAVDIGVNLETKDALLEAGAVKLVCGSAILDADNPRKVFEELSA